jgi:hypothetical protein
MTGQPGFRAFSYSMFVGVEEFWPGSLAVALEAVEVLDRPTDCEAVALEAHRRFGFEVAYGAVLALDLAPRPAWHFWLSGPHGEVIDPARKRRIANGYIGKRLEPFELERQQRLANPLAPLRENADQVGDLGRGIARVLFG